MYLGVILNISASGDEFNNEKYATFFIGDWDTVNIKAEKVLFSIIRNIKIEFKDDYRFFAEADFILGIYKSWHGNYKISSNKIYLLFDNGARETIYYNKLNQNSIHIRQPEKITANLIKEIDKQDLHS